MLSKNRSKLIRSLKHKKYRYEKRLFTVEGRKIIEELLRSNLKIHSIYSSNTSELIIHNKSIEHIQVTDSELKEISTLESPDGYLAVVHFPEHFSNWAYPQNTSLLLDRINDPGNLGTIIRIADWFGITDIYCSNDTVDCFNSKTVQAAKGSLFRVKVYYMNLESIIEWSAEQKMQVLAADLKGTNCYELKWQKPCLIILGNEANGISKSLIHSHVKNITIPGAGNTESLNVAVSCGIICSEYFKAIIT